MGKQFEIAKKIYAAHRLLVNAPPLDRQKIEDFLNQNLVEFEAAGGVMKIGTNLLGNHGPVLSIENGDVVPYEAGRMLAESFISSGIFR